MKQRASFSIITLILLALQQKPLTKTKLMQELVFSYNRVNHYCSFLEHHSLIEYDPTNHTYSITPRGEEVLRLSKELAEYIWPIDQMIKKYSFYIPGQYYPVYRSNNKNTGKPTMTPQHVH